MKGLLTLLSILTLALSSAVAQEQASPPVVEVGTLFPYTGAGAEFGPVVRNAAELAADQINAAATRVFGGPILELIHEDTETTPSAGVEAARRLVEIEGVPVVVGTWSSGVTVAVATAVTMPSQVLHVVPIATSPLITVLPADTDDLLFRTIGSTAQESVVAAQLASGELIEDYDFETASIIYVNNAYGQAAAQQFVRSFEKRGGTILASVPVPAEPQPTYAAALSQVLADDPELFLPILYPGQATVLLQEARDLFDVTTYQFNNSLRSPEVLEAVGPETLAGQLGTAPAANKQSPGYQRFAEAYKAAYGELPPLPYGDTTYDAIAVVGLAIASAIAEGSEITPTNLRDQLRQIAAPPGESVGVGEFERAFSLLLAGEDIDYSGAAGEVNFDEHGQAITPVAIWRFTEEGFETVMLRSAEEIPAE